MYNFDNCTLLTYIFVTKITGFTVLVAKFQVSRGGHYNISDYFYSKIKLMKILQRSDMANGTQMTVKACWPFDMR